jgi:hypothetical protein
MRGRSRQLRPIRYREIVNKVNSVLNKELDRIPPLIFFASAQFTTGIMRTQPKGIIMENNETITESTSASALGYLALGTIAGGLMILSWSALRNWKMKRDFPYDDTESE